jgi:hypothetical protein
MSVTTRKPKKKLTRRNLKSQIRSITNSRKELLEKKKKLQTFMATGWEAPEGVTVRIDARVDNDWFYGNKKYDIALEAFCTPEERAKIAATFPKRLHWIKKFREYSGNMEYAANTTLQGIKIRLEVTVAGKHIPGCRLVKVEKQRITKDVSFELDCTPVKRSVVS